MTEVILLAIALSMDAFAVSIGLGAKTKINFLILALKAGLFFGAFQAFMPLIGYLGGKSLLGWVADYAHIIAFGLLSIIGAKMFYESFTGVIDEVIDKDQGGPALGEINADKAENTSGPSNRMLLLLAIATSIDALAAGFTLNLLAFDPFQACAIIGLITFGFSVVGVYVGKATGTVLESNAERLGGVVLILLGLKILLV
ncbi:MAG: manganese efflux pump MntP family protein [SAR324 cluster bacterium]|nr:manganese efflux pump MntP family protein [SAR324 cluster bacterium]